MVQIFQGPTIYLCMSFDRLVGKILLYMSTKSWRRCSYTLEYILRYWFRIHLHLSGYNWVKMCYKERL